MKCGIYGIINLLNEKIYIGLSKNIESRFLFHKRRLISNTHKNKHLQAAFNKVGINNFSFIIIEECLEEKLCEKEKYYIAEYKSVNNKFGYNKTHGGEFGKLNDEIIKRTAEKLRQQVISEDMRKRISNTLKGRTQSKELINKRANSCRKVDDKSEKLVIDLYITKNYTRNQIVEALNIKKTLIQSIIRRSGLLKNKIYE